MVLRRTGIIDKFCRKHARARKSFGAWIAKCQAANWKNFSDIKKTFNTVDKNGDDLIFDIAGNNYRLIAVVSFEDGILTIKEVMTHADYDRNYK